MPVDLDRSRAVVVAVLRTGLRPAKLLSLPEVFNLPNVRSTAGGSGAPLDLAFAAEAVLREALARLGDGPYGQAAALLFGAAAESWGLPLKTRRRLAAEELDVYPSTFRKLYEPSLLDDVVIELLRGPLLKA
jgi:hypothetical protein